MRKIGLYSLAYVDASAIQSRKRFRQKLFPVFTGKQGCFTQPVADRNYVVGVLSAKAVGRAKEFLQPCGIVMQTRRTL